MTTTADPGLWAPRLLLKVSVGVALVTIVMKTAAWWLTDSVGLLSDAMESLVNLAGAMFGLVMVTVADQPPDDQHPYGHGKAEYFSSGFEGILIVAAALGIGWAAVDRLMHPRPVEQVGWGLALSIVSSALNAWLAWAMFRSARHHRSVALEADARHLVTDVWTSVGVVAGLLAVQATGWLWLDPLVGLAVALNILREGAHLIWRSSQGLMDEAVPPDVLARIREALDEVERQEGGAVRCDHLMTRQAGQRSFVALHLHVPPDWTLAHAAALRGRVGRALQRAVPQLSATVELLPADDPEQGFGDTRSAP